MSVSVAVVSVLELVLIENTHSIGVTPLQHTQYPPSSAVSPVTSLVLLCYFCSHLFAVLSLLSVSALFPPFRFLSSVLRYYLSSILHAVCCVLCVAVSVYSCLQCSWLHHPTCHQSDVIHWDYAIQYYCALYCSTAEHYCCVVLCCAALQVTSTFVSTLYDRLISVWSLSPNMLYGCISSIPYYGVACHSLVYSKTE